MAKSRPFCTFYSDGTQGNATTAHRAAIRAFKKVIEGECKRAVVTNNVHESILSVEKRYSTVTINVKKAKEFA
jgi:predicted nucleic acid-binding protein